MIENRPFTEGEERVFTFSDIRALFARERKKVFRIGFLFGFFCLAFFLLKSPQYLIEASFKEGVDHQEGGASLLSGLLMSSSFASSEPQASAFMKSNRVLSSVVRELGLQANIQERGGIFSKVYRRVRDNVLAEFGLPLKDKERFVFRDVFFEEEKKKVYPIVFETNASFRIGEEPSLFSLGETVVLPDATFRITKIPDFLRLKQSYPLEFEPLMASVGALKRKLEVVANKTNRSIYDLRFSHRDRHLAVSIVNELMAAYQRHLKQDHDEVATEQLAYLTFRQDQIFQRLSDVLDEESSYLKQNLVEEGEIGQKEGGEAVLIPCQQIAVKLLEMEIELGRLDRWALQEREVVPADEGPFSRRLLEIHRSMSDLRQQKDLLELALQKKNSFLDLSLEERQTHLRELREQKEEAKSFLDSLVQGKSLPLTVSFDPDRSLASWASQLKEKEKGDVLSYLGNQIRLFSLQEKMVQDRFFSEKGEENPFQGIDRSTLNHLFVQYHQKLDIAQAAMGHYAQLQKELDERDFEISSLSSVLHDPLSQKLIAEASVVGIQLKDEHHHSAKEGRRWEEELRLQKKILKDHLEQLLKVESLNVSLLEEKITHLQKVHLDSIQRELSVLSEQISDAIQERRAALLEEKGLLEEKLQGLRQKMSLQLPEKWRFEKELQLKTEIGTKVMEGVAELVESKTMSHHLHHVESKPLDLAFPPLLPKSPQILIFSFLSAFFGGFGFFFLRLLKTLSRGFPSSYEKLRALQFPVLGSITSFVDGEITAQGDDLDLFRKISFFLQEAPNGKVVSLIGGKGPDYSFALAANLARRSIRPLVIRCDFPIQSASSEKPGLFEMWKGDVRDGLIRTKLGVDYVSAGGYTPYGVEIIQSEMFCSFLEEMKRRYDVLLLLFRSPLHLADSLAPLVFSDRVVVTVSGEPTEQLTPFIHWAYHEEKPRLTFIVSDRI